MSIWSRFTFAAVVIIILLGLVGAYIYMRGYNGGRRTLKVFCAGSLKIPLENVSEVYKERYGVDVYIEASGSVEAVRKITDLGKSADALAVADYRLIPNYLYPKYAEWYIGFASNQVVLVYTSKSRYSSELADNNSLWYDVLSRSGVRWGFSDPNKDPCGYRAVGVIGLASIYYNKSAILEDLLLRNTNFQAKTGDGSLEVDVPSSIDVKTGSLSIRPKSVDLIALLETGGLDYAFEYKSVAVQHNLKYVELPPEINLGDPKYSKFYSKVSVNILTGTDKERKMTMAPIVYGITIPSTASNKDLAIKFVQLILSDKGRKIFSSLGQSELEKPIYNGSIPSELEVYVEHE